MLKQFQNLTDQMTLLIKNQQFGPPLQIESGNHTSGFWCTNCQQHGHTLQFCRNGPNRNQRTNNNGPQQNLRGPSQNQGNNRGPPPREQTNQSTEKKKFHHLCGRYHVIGQCWSENQGQVCNN